MNGMNGYVNEWLNERPGQKIVLKTESTTTTLFVVCLGYTLFGKQSITRHHPLPSRYQTPPPPVRHLLLFIAT